jgi:methyl-accepting chemotaxis protein
METAGNLTAMEEVSAYAQNLAQLSESMHGLVDRFQLKMAE